MPTVHIVHQKDKGTIGV